MLKLALYVPPAIVGELAVRPALGEQGGGIRHGPEDQPVDPGAAPQLSGEFRIGLEYPAIRSLPLPEPEGTVPDRRAGTERVPGQLSGRDIPQHVLREDGQLAPAEEKIGMRLQHETNRERVYHFFDPPKSRLDRTQIQSLLLLRSKI